MSAGTLIKVNPGLLSAMSQGGFSLDVFSKEIPVLECLISGTTFTKLDVVEPELNVGVELKTKREPKNEYDNFAVSLWINGLKAGYLPREKNEVIARLMDAGKMFFAYVLSKEWEGAWLKVEVKVVGRF